MDSPSVVDMNNYTLYIGAELYEAYRAAFEADTKRWVSENLKVKQKQPEIMKGNELDIKVTNRSNAYGNDRTYRYLINGESVMRFDQIPFPECCGIAIIKNFSANGDLSKADFLDAMGKFIADIKSNDRFSKVLFYTNIGSNGEKLFSQLPNSIILDPFKNRRSGNTLIGFEIDLLEKSANVSWRSVDLGDDEDVDEEYDEDEEESLDETMEVFDEEARAQEHARWQREAERQAEFF